MREELLAVEKSKIREVEDVKAQFEHWKNIDIRDQEIRFSAERSAFETQIMQLQQRLEELQQGKQSLTNENNDLRHRIEEKVREFELQRSKENSLVNSKQLEIEELRKNLEHFKRLYRVSKFFL